MIARTLIGATTAVLIAAGSLAATAGSASATGYGYGGPGYGPIAYKWKPHKVCNPVFKKVAWWDHWGRKHVKKVKVGVKCHWVYPYKHKQNW